MILIALILAAAPADAVPKARQAYASCLGGYTNDSIEKKMAKDEFLAGLKTKCTDKETAFRAALIAADKADGMTDAEAKEDADDQVAGYMEQMTDNFDSAK